MLLKILRIIAIHQKKIFFLIVPSRELSFKKGDTVYILRKIDQNWYEGEHHGRVGIFPISYVEVSLSPSLLHGCCF